jgi:hypothetical protein
MQAVNLAAAQKKTHPGWVGLKRLFISAGGGSKPSKSLTPLNGGANKIFSYLESIQP